ncbi:ea3d34ff-1983-430a-8415-f0b7acc106b5 [Thermothielavioides terrestris]|uniref:Ea3d34ff-1983-430a-8415-f0b7acc106b5 n=1 Tax=Thermothielavioides terrestris TaxID=2587410 RepID=A0A3S5CWI5_9PEZI|nr:ea3d34ff-1983-430a-8415-f0b7acc106b5 [Thermothielavioides terrestris]
MAALGGLGYLLNEETPQVGVARLFRDACVGAIWEGTTDVLASDALRALVPRTRHGDGDGGDDVVGADGRMEALLPEARAVVFRLAEVLSAVLFMADAAANPGAEIEEMCRRYVVEKRFVPGQEAASSRL